MFYSDILKNVNSRVGYNPEELDGVDTPIDKKFSFSTEPNKNINIDFSKTYQSKFENHGEKTSFEKINSKFKIETNKIGNFHDSYTTTTTFGFIDNTMSFAIE